MKLGVKKLSSAVRLGLSLGAVIAVGVSTSAFAQDTSGQQNNQPADQQNAKTLQTVVVTGSRIRRVDLETANPVTTVTREEIKSSGKLTAGDLLQELPAIAGAATNPNVNNGGGDGASTVSLRGLGSQRTLILVNGHRVARNDINAIPASMIDRIEVLKDGASATYGSDAIGGVVNFILRKNFQGLELSANVGESDHNDGTRRGFSALFGTAGDKGSITAGIDYNKFDEISSAKRDFSKYATYLSSGSVYHGGSSRNPNGYVSLPTGPVTLAHPVNGKTSTSDYRPYNSKTDSFNYQAVNLITTPQERFNAFALATYQVTDNLQAHLDFFYNKTSSHFAIAPLPFDAKSDGVVVSAQNYYNPFGINFGPGGRTFRSRFTTLGQRMEDFATQTGQVNAGLKGSVGDTSWQWSADLNYGHVGQDTIQHGYVYYNGLKSALGPSFLDPVSGKVTCGTPTAPVSGCTPLNIFNVNDPQTISTLGNYAAAPFGHTLITTRRAEVNANGDLFSLPAGTVSLAVGADYEKDYQNVQVDYIARTSGAGGTCFISQEACATPLSGSFNVKEVYGELFVPLLTGLPGIKSLNLTLGSRYSSYSSAGSRTSNKVALEWRPVDDLLVRGTMEGVFRAPTISDLYAGAAGSAPQLTDPCIGYTGGHAAACANVPTNGSFKGSGLSQTTAVVSGSVAAGYNLKPEYGKSFDFGAVYDPHFIPGLSLSADYWRVHLNDTITPLGVQNTMSICYANGSSPFCSFIHRDDTGQILFINSPTVNLGTLNTSGIDFTGKYKIPHFDVAGINIGDFAVSLNTTYLIKYDNDTAPGQTGDVINHLAGMYNNGYGNYTRWRGVGMLNWSTGPWSATWKMRYFGALNVGSRNTTESFSADGGIPNVVLRVPTMIYNDLAVAYNIAQWNTTLNVGVDNLFDKQPPLMYQNNVLNANTDVNTYDTIGRYFFAGVTVKF